MFVEIENNLWALLNAYNETRPEDNRWILLRNSNVPLNYESGKVYLNLWLYSLLSEDTRTIGYQQENATFYIDITVQDAIEEVGINDAQILLMQAIRELKELLYSIEFYSFGLPVGSISGRHWPEFKRFTINNLTERDIAGGRFSFGVSYAFKASDNQEWSKGKIESVLNIGDENGNNI